MISKQVLIKGLIGLTVLLLPAAFAQDPTANQTGTATLTAVNTMSLDTANNAAFAITLALGATPVQDSNTVLTFDTNDGANHKITVQAQENTASANDFWKFTPENGTSAAGTYPELRFFKAVVSGATGNTVSASTTPGVLIAADNNAAAVTAGTGAPIVDVVTSINNAAGTVTVTLDASIDETVVAGTYDGKLLFTFESL
ncbi:MAG: hypothetical protein WD273_08330 [Trueperaceae bacterium]